MPMLNPSAFTATVEAILINRSGDDLTTTAIDSTVIDFTGIPGEFHGGLTRASCSRVTRQYPKGTEIRNTRQLTALSSEELQAIGEALTIDELDPALIGANLIIRGIPDFSQVPPSSRLIAENGTSLVVDMQNAPCRFPGDIIEQHHPGKGKGFAAAALGKRGVTLWVEREGKLTVGDTLTLHLPPRVTWQHGDTDTTQALKSV